MQPLVGHIFFNIILDLEADVLLKFYVILNTKLDIKHMRSLSFMQASESTTVKSKLDEREECMNSVQKMSETEAEASPGNVPVTANRKVSGNLKHIVNHDDVFEV